jgi:membrane-bound metal-dependent hydrolase YbcI (DUF457 family)
MLIKTHLAFAFIFILLFFQQVNHKFIFITLLLIATILPDIDSGFSSWGRHLIFRPLQFFLKHRGLLHSLTAGIVLSAVLAFFWPVASLGFFVGYSAHLIFDSFTKEGIQPFWPFKSRSKGFIVSGGRIEESIFLGLVFADVILFFIVFVLI